MFLGLAIAVLVAAGVRRHIRRRRIWLAAFLEQGRVEAEHRLPFRFDQKVNAIQQRLSRDLGAEAFRSSTRRRIEAEVRRADAPGWE
jgi:hypothetical protein